MILPFEPNPEVWHYNAMSKRVILLEFQLTCLSHLAYEFMRSRLRRGVKRFWNHPQLLCFCYISVGSDRKTEEDAYRELSDRDMDMRVHLASGKTHAEIGHILNLSVKSNGDVSVHGERNWQPKLLNAFKSANQVTDIFLSSASSVASHIEPWKIELSVSLVVKIGCY